MYGVKIIDWPDPQKCTEMNETWITDQQSWVYKLASSNWEVKVNAKCSKKILNMP